MSFLSLVNEPSACDARRVFLGKSGLLLSGAAIALLVGKESLAKGSESTVADARILNTALGAELEAIVHALEHVEHALAVLRLHPDP